MKITKLEIEGAFLLEMEEFKDERGSFARQFCKKEMAEYGIDFDIKQCNLSRNRKKGTLRGMHYQKDPYPEIKMVSCSKGKILDVLVDIRKDSPTYKKWVKMELSETNNRTIYVPANVAHGFLTLEDESSVYYQIGEFFMPDYYSGVRWNDPAFNIDWGKIDNIIINERDANYELWK